MHPEETERRERLLTEIGRLVVAYSNAENVLVVIFATLRGDFRDAPKAFRSRNSFSDKLDLVNETVRTTCAASELTSWKPLYEGLQKYRGLRNRVAHSQEMPDIVEGSLHFFLRGATFTPHRTEDHIAIEGIRAAAYAVERIQKKLWTFEKAIRHEPLSTSGHRIAVAD